MKIRLLSLVIIFFSFLPARAQVKALFSAAPKQGCSPLKVDFFNASQNAVSWLWDFGNGNKSTIQSPSAVYNSPGKFTVTLIATDSKGKTDTLVVTNYITVFKAPEAALSVDKKQACAGVPFNFKDQSKKGDGDINSWTWNFGDGGAASSQHPGYTYTLDGKFDITLRVKDVNGCENLIKEVKFVEVYPQPKVLFTAPDRIKCKPPITVNFTSTVSGTAPLTYLWDFGDGNTSNAANPSHDYQGGGKFDVALRVTDGKGCSNTVSKDDYVQLVNPAADFNVIPRKVCMNSKVFFQNKCTPASSSGQYLWEFGDGGTSGAYEPEYYFSTAGTFTVKLTYKWEGCEVTRTKTNFITVDPLPLGQISPRDTTICRNSDPLDFIVKGKDVQRIEWYSNDSLKGKDLHFMGPVPFDKNGVFNIHAVLVSASGCKNITDPIKLTVRGPIAMMGVKELTGCIPRDIVCENTSTCDKPLKSFSWSTSYGASATTEDWTFNYDKFKTSRLSLYVEDVDGCTDNTDTVIMGGIKVDLKCVCKKTEVCRNEPVWIYNKSKPISKDSVLFSWDWYYTTMADSALDDKMVKDKRDSVLMMLPGKPNALAKLNLVANSYGCITKLPVNARPQLKILGPLAGGDLSFDCVKDSLKVTNKSTDYSAFHWEVVTNGGSYNSSAQSVQEKLSETQYIRMITENDTTGCRDTANFQVMINPDQLDFTYNFNCKTNEFSTANNDYQLKPPEEFVWTILNTNTGDLITSSSRDVVQPLTKPGLYKITLNLSNSSWMCTKAKTVYLRVYEKNTAPPTATIDRTTCYPVELELQDPAWKQWKQAEWKVGHDKFKDSLQKFKFSYTDNQSDLKVVLARTDSNNCFFSDTFLFKIGGWRVYMYLSQNDENCTRSVVTAQSLIIGYNNPVTYAWKFGNLKTSNKKSDTLHIKKWMTLPVTLRVSDNNGCASEDYMEADIRTSAPNANFKATGTDVSCPPMDVTFTDISQAGASPIVSRKWNLGDTSFSDKLQPKKLYIYPGKYGVSLVVTNANGCSDTMDIPDFIVVKGPTGSYSMDKKEGCTPLPVVLTTQTSSGIKKFEFDMGDGVVLNKAGQNHLFTRPGTYIPRLILTDSNDCRFSPPAKDTIYVYPNPIAHFETEPVCNNRVYSFKDYSYYQGETPAGVAWYADGIFKGTADPLQIIFNQQTYNKLQLIASTDHGCRDTLEKLIKSYDIRPLLKTNKEEFCVNDLIRLSDESSADTALQSRSIWVNGVLQPYANPMTISNALIGKNKVYMVLQDALGCKDTFDSDAFIRVGDTVAPPLLRMFRSTVLDDQSTGSSFARSSAPDFKEYRLWYYDGIWKQGSSSANLNDTDLVVNGLNTLKNSYCHKIQQMNFCLKGSDLLGVVPHCTVETKAEGDTNLARVWWSAYSGWPVQQYNIHRKKRDGNNFVYLNTVPGNTLNYNDTDLFCHSIYDYKIEAVELGGNAQRSFSDTAMAIPIHNMKVPAPEVWRSTVENNSYVLTEWKQVQQPKFAVAYYSLWKAENSSAGIFKENISAGNFSETDLKLNVQSQNAHYWVQATDVCDTKSALSNEGVNILLRIHTDPISAHPMLNWNAYTHWNEGVVAYGVERLQKDGKFKEIGKVDRQTLQFLDGNIPLYCEKDFIYRVLAYREQPANYPDSTHDVLSVSNHAAFLPETKIFIPNAFTPNENNLNETFAPKGQYIYSYTLKVYSRWGEKLYESGECMNGWNGMYNGQQAPDGVYVYTVEAVGMDGKHFKFSGTFHLLR